MFGVWNRESSLHIISCVYPEYNQMDENNPSCVEDSVYPRTRFRIWLGKVICERLYLSFRKNYGIDTKIEDYIISLLNGNI